MNIIVILFILYFKKLTIIEKHTIRCSTIISYVAMEIKIYACLLKSTHIIKCNGNEVEVGDSDVNKKKLLSELK